MAIFGLPGGAEWLVIATTIVLLFVPGLGFLGLGYFLGRRSTQREQPPAQPAMTPSARPPVPSPLQPPAQPPAPPAAPSADPPADTEGPDADA
ncbi:MAG TPA: hypothetical protein VF902_05065 [Coriobacteriia bacterium]